MPNNQDSPERNEEGNVRKFEIVDLLPVECWKGTKYIYVYGRMLAEYSMRFCQIPHLRSPPSFSKAAVCFHATTNRSERPQILLFLEGESIQAFLHGGSGREGHGEEADQTQASLPEANVKNSW